MKNIGYTGTVMNQNRFVITGTGRCGTEYLSFLLRLSHIKCGHQDVFRHENTLSGEWDWKDYEGDSSFEAVPMLHKIKEEGTKIIHVIRNEDDVVSSWVSLGVFRDDMEQRYNDFYRVLQDFDSVVMKKMTPENRCRLFYRSWNDYAAEYADHTIQIEEFQPVDIFVILDRLDAYNEATAKALKQNVNNRKLHDKRYMG